MSPPLTRRAFLRGQVSSHGVPRPPGSGRETDFTLQCTRCAECIRTCPEAIISPDASGYPQLDLSIGGCTFCHACIEACPADALQHGRDWFWRVSVAPDCLALNRVYCRTCGDACESGAIRFRLRTGGVSEPLVDEMACSGCGACVGACPGSALRMVLIDAASADAASDSPRVRTQTSGACFPC